METRITLKELAKSLNLSVSTVSKSINNSLEISPLTKKRVTELATLKRYVPTLQANWPYYTEIPFQYSTIIVIVSFFIVPIIF